MLDMLLPADAARKHDHAHAHAHAHAHDDASSPTAAGSHATSFFTQMPLSIVGSFLRRQTPSPSPSRSPHSAAPAATTTATAAPDLTPLDTSAPVQSRPASSGSSAATVEKLQKRAPRSKTSYVCAWPPRSKLHRPKVVLQLHQVIPSQRPKPTYEVIPFSLLPSRSSRRLARTFNTKERLGSHDLLIVKAQDYASKTEHKKSDDENWGAREVIGVICPAKSDKDVTEICMDDGVSRWEVTNMQNGGLEFNTADEHGLNVKARWVPKPVHSRRTSGMSNSSQASPALPTGQDDKKYSFSTINPNSRRHPIIATMTSSRIDVMDSYAMPSGTSPSTPLITAPQSPPITPSSIDMTSFLDKQNDKAPIQTDDALHRFIVVSGIWVAQHGLYSHSSPSSNETHALDRSSMNRSMSFIDSPRSASPASTTDGNHRSFPKMLRTGTDRLPRCMSFSDSQSPISTRSPNASPVPKTRSRRANSTGNASLHGMSGSMRKRHGLSFQGEVLPETEEERQGKRSAELLRIKELTLPTALERISSEVPLSTTPFQPSTSLPPPIVIPPSSDGPKSPIPVISPAFSSPDLRNSERTRKSQSTYNPLVTAGMWDSGVVERPGLKARPTSMFVINEKKRKQERKRERSRNKEDSDKGVPCKKNDWQKLKTSLKGIFKKEKA